MIRLYEGATTSQTHPATRMAVCRHGWCGIYTLRPARNIGCLGACTRKYINNNHEMMLLSSRVFGHDIVRLCCYFFFGIRKV